MSNKDQPRLSMETVDPAVEPVEDKVHRAVRAGLQTIPLVGGIANEVFLSIFVNPADKRRTEWMHSATELINEISVKLEKPLSILAEDPAFVSTVFTATTLAMRTSEPDKLEALKAAIFNSAADASNNEAIQQMHLSALASLTSIHLHLLNFFEGRDPDAVKALGKPSLDQARFYTDAAPYFGETVQPGILHRAANDLASAGLIAVPPGFPVSLSGPNFVTMMLTDFGRSFVAFIRRPGP